MRIFYRIGFYILGLFLLAIGSVLSINSGLGVSPVNSLPYSISIISGIHVGTCATIVFAVYIVIQAALQRNEFKPINLLELVFSWLFGMFVNLVRGILGDFAIPTYAGKLLMSGIGILLVALGLTFYLGSNIVPMPMEGMTMAITKKLKRFPFHSVKIVVDCASVALAAILSFIFLRNVSGLREGTVIAAILTGKVLEVISKRISPVIKGICFGKAK